MGLGDPYEGVVHPKGVATCVRTTALEGAALSVRVFPGILDKKGGKEQRKEYLNYMQTPTSGSHRFPTLAQPESSPHLFTPVVFHPHLLSILQCAQMLLSVFLCSVNL